MDRHQGRSGQQNRQRLIFRGRDLDQVRRYADRAALHARLGVLQRKYVQCQDRYEIQGTEVVQLREENRTLRQRWNDVLERVVYLAQPLYGEKSERQQSLAAAVLEDTREPGSETEADQEPSQEHEPTAMTEVAPTGQARHGMDANAIPNAPRDSNIEPF